MDSLPDCVSTVLRVKHLLESCWMGSRKAHWRQHIRDFQQQVYAVIFFFVLLCSSPAEPTSYPLLLPSQRACVAATKPDAGALHSCELYFYTNTPTGRQRGLPRPIYQLYFFRTKARYLLAAQEQSVSLRVVKC